MHLKIEATKAANREAALADVLYRTTDALERAKTALRRRGWIVFSHNVLEPHSELIVVGRQLLTEEQVIAHAERFCPRNPQEA